MQNADAEMVTPICTLHSALCTLHSAFLLLDHPDLDLGLHVRMEPDRHAVNAQSLDRLMQVNLALFDAMTQRLELLDDVAGGDGAEQLALLADPRRKRERHLLKDRDLTLRLLSTRVFRGLESLPLRLDLLLVAFRRDDGDAARQEVVAGEAVGDLHHIARVPELFD